MAANIIMKRGTAAAYNALSVRDGNTLYFLIDTGEIYLGGTLMSVTDLSGKVDKVNGKDLSSNDFTDALKTKLEGLSNQKVFSNIVVGNTTIAADSSNDTFTIVQGDNITITPDASGDKITISSTYQNDNTTYTLTKVGNEIKLVGSDGSETKVTDANDNTTYSNATQTAAGLMSSGDKAKLDGIASGANKYSLPTASATVLGGVKVGSGLSISSGVLSANNPSWSNVQNKPSTFTPSEHEHTLDEVSDTETRIAMTPDERTKLSGIAAGANKYVHPAYTAKSSGLYKVTVDATGHVSAVAAATKADITALGIPAQDTKYTHPSHTAYESGIYKVTVDSLGHVINAVEVTKADITALGIPGSDTNTTYTAGEGLSLDGTEFNVNTGYTTSGKNYAVKTDATTGGLYVNVPWTDNNTTYKGSNGVTVSGTTISNSGVRSISTGSANGTISVNTNGTSANVAVKGLGSAAYTASSAYATSAQGTKADSALQAADKTELQGNIDTVSGKVTTLIGSDADKSVRAIAAEEIAAQLIAEDADASLDTLQEIALWIQNHPKDVAEMNANIATAQSTADTAKANAATAQSTADTHIANKSNPHGVTKSQLGLGSVENKSSATIRGELTKANVTKALGYTPANTADAYVHPSYTAKDAGLYKVTVDATGHVSEATAVEKADITALGIPAQDTVYTHPAYTAKASGLYKVTVDAKGHVSGTAAVTKADITALGIPGSDTNTTYGIATASTAGLVKIGYTASGKNYPVQLSEGKMFVNVPWTDNNTTYSAGTGLSMDGTKFNVNVGYTTSGKNYAVKADDSGNLYVNVPWTDTNTVYTHPSYTAKASGFYKVTVDSTGHVSGTAAVTKADITGLGIPGANTNTTYTLTKDGSTITLTGSDGSTTSVEDTDTNTTYSAATASVAGLMSAADKSKLDGIASGANKYVLPTASSSLGGVKTTSTVTSATGYTACPIISGVPYYKDTNTTYTLGSFGITATASELNILDGVTASADELNILDGVTASTEEINYLDGVTSNIQTQLDGKSSTGHSHSAYVNQNAFSKATVGSTTINAGTTTDTITFAAGSNVTLTPDATNKKITISSTNTTYSDATTSAHGLMTAADKTKLNGIATGANKYVHPAHTAHDSGLYKVKVDATGHVSEATEVVKGDITALGIPAQDTTYGVMGAATSSAAGTSGLVPAPAKGKQLSFLRGDGAWVVPNNTTYPNATSSNAGLMSAGDKSKLDGIAAGADAVSFSASLTSGTKVGTITINGTATTLYCQTNTNTTYTAGDGLTLSGTEFNVNTGYTTSGKSYAVQVDSESGGLYVDVPWTDTVYTHPSYTSKSSGLYKITVDSKGHVSAATAVAKADITGLGIPGSDADTTYTLTKSGSTITLTGSGGTSTSVTDSDTNTTYSVATASKAGLVKPVSVITKPTVNSATTTAGRYYPVQMSSDGNMFVNVPWNDTNTVYSHPSYTPKSSGLYKIAVDDTGHVSGVTAVTKADITGLGIPGSDTNTTYGIATANTAGLVKPVSVITKPTVNAATTTASRYYPVQMSSDGNMFVNVPWSNTDTNTYGRSGNTSSKIFLIGTTTQSTSNKTTYSHDTVYVGTDGHLYSTNSNHSTAGIVALESDFEWGDI